MKSAKDYEYLKKSNYELSDIELQFIMAHYDAFKSLHDYGTGEYYTFVEVHTVTKIEEDPGITVTELAQKSNRTKGAISQTVARLETKGLVRKEKDADNSRCIHLYVTEKGLKLSQCHKKYDEQTAEPLYEDIAALFGYDALDKHFRILEYRLRVLKKMQDEAAALSPSSQKATPNINRKRPSRYAREGLFSYISHTAFNQHYNSQRCKNTICNIFPDENAKGPCI